MNALALVPRQPSEERARESDATRVDGPCTGLVEKIDTFVLFEACREFLHHVKTKANLP